MCGKKLKGKQKKWCSRKCNWAYTAQHRWTNAKRKLKESNAWWQCAHCKNFTQKIEVNHIVPCRGAHGKWGCHHHANNLELICKSCHQTETNAQRARGWT